MGEHTPTPTPGLWVLGEQGETFVVAAPELLEALERVAELDGHGCLTGDCPHKSNVECVEELAVVLTEMITMSDPHAPPASSPASRSPTSQQAASPRREP